MCAFRFRAGISKICCSRAVSTSDMQPTFAVETMSAFHASMPKAISPLSTPKLPSGALPVVMSANDPLADVRELSINSRKRSFDNHANIRPDAIRPDAFLRYGSEPFVSGPCSGPGQLQASRPADFPTVRCGLHRRSGSAHAGMCAQHSCSPSRPSTCRR